MPKTEVKKVVCLKCGKTTEVKLSTSINAAEDLNIRRELLSGRLFSFKCSACGYTGKLFYPVLYNDTKNKFMVYLIPDVDRFQIADKDIEKAIRLAPDDPVVYVLRALGKLARYERESAEADLKRAVELSYDREAAELLLKEEE